MVGPVWGQREAGAPVLSWFDLSAEDARDERHADDPLTNAVRRLLITDPSLGTSPALPSLMERVVALRADALQVISPQVPPALTARVSRPAVLLLDQPIGPGASAESFKRLAATASLAHPGADLWIWPLSGRRRGGLSEIRLPAGRYHRLAEGGSLFAALSRIDHVYTISAPEGMQVLLAGVPLHVLGRPYYAGLGLTHDMEPESTAAATPMALFDAVYIRLAQYLDLGSQGAGTLANVLDAIELQRAVQFRYADCRQVVAMRFQLWKRRFALPYLMAGGGRVSWRTALTSNAAIDGRVALWGSKTAEGMTASTPTLRMEDGFFHSDGLGSDMVAPRSQVLDRLGLYFDARKPCELTHILNSATFDRAELARAAELRELVCRLGVTKYNMGRRTPIWRAPVGKTVILVAGQVADDASIRFGTGAIGTAQALLEEVRARNPDSFIVYKPHPDVLSGNRKGLVEAQGLADVVDAEADVLSLVDRADQVHILSSLVGFDALLRGKRVFTYGLPFYAGWGLTEDALPQPWRERRLSLDMLVAGALLRYPVYWDWHSRLFTTPESVVRELGMTAGRPLVRIAEDRLRWPRKIWRWGRNVVWFGWWSWVHERRARAGRLDIPEGAMDIAAKGERI
ncbi:capsular polysaccharide export protein, LipB/KpsS family [Cupriavidus necator]